MVRLPKPWLAVASESTAGCGLRTLVKLVSKSFFTIRGNFLRCARDSRPRTHRIRIRKSTPTVEGDLTVGRFGSCRETRAERCVSFFHDL